MSDKPPAAYLAGLTMLARRELSSARLRDKLQRKGYPPREIEETIDRLQDEGALDDRRTADALANRAAHLRLQGKYRAIRELQSHGIDRDLARQVVDEVYDEIDSQALLTQALGKRLTGSIESPAQLRRLYQYLVRQGFDSAAARTALLARATPAATRRLE